MAQSEAQTHRDAQGGTVLFESGADAPLRMVSLVALTFAVASLVLAGMLLDTDVKLGNGISGTERAVWAGGLMLLLIGFMTAVGMYRRRVASKITLSADGKTLAIETPSMFFGRGVHNVHLDDVVRSQFHTGDKRGEEALATPWLHVHVKHQRSFFVPLGGNIPDKGRLIQLLGASR